jgi:hypothetical protein
VFLIAVGAILRFAVHKSVSGLDIRTVGVILMIAGALGLAITAAVYGPRRRSTLVHERTVSGQPTVTGPTVVAGPTVVEPTVDDRVTAERVERHEVY